MAMQKFRAPTLPVPPEKYDQQYLTQLIRSLGGYFRQLDSLTPIEADTFKGGGELLANPHGEFYDTTTQVTAVINTAYAFTFNTTVVSHDVRLGTPTSRIIVPTDGRYRFYYSAQVDKSSGGTAIVNVWIRKNGVDVTYSARRITIQGSSQRQVIADQFVVNMAAYDYLEVMWSADSTTIQFLPFAASAPVPGISSVHVTALFVSTV